MILYITATAVAITAAGIVGFIIGRDNRDYARGRQDGYSDGYDQGRFDGAMDAAFGDEERQAAEDARTIRTGHSDVYDHEEDGL